MSSSSPTEAPLIQLGNSYRGAGKRESSSSDAKQQHRHAIKQVAAGEQKLDGWSVAIDVVASGLCGTDLHYLGHDIGLGHEGVGVVSALGSALLQDDGAEAKKLGLKVGSRVGWGYVQGACLACLPCVQGVDTMCRTRKLYGVANKHQGSIGDAYVVDARFVHLIPDALPLVYAAPLQCAGATVFGAIHACADLKPWHRIGVLAIGGLGHLAIQYLSKMGCHVVVFSTSDSKREEAFKLGASEFVATGRDNKELKSAIKSADWKGSVDYLFVASSVQPDWDTYLHPRILSSRATVIPLSVSADALHIKGYQQLISKEIRIQGSMVASRAVHRIMLDFSARTRSWPWIELLPMSPEGVEEAVNRLDAGQVRYRFVLQHPTHKDPLFPDHVPGPALQNKI
ncbi:Alcohol dehydrogenase, class V [Ceraceosorus bombacis]|uniref:Alcohol dehydrogenase, class V n=1 Tax=Ceraceosorus bombacis TaxID=401625 RepID=A0A0P1BRA8_9BASI|nr:Alcohol dehydrogenase, class V [Ceraceosorus bombacis]